MFDKSAGGAIKYNDLELHCIDRIPVEKNFSGHLRLISTNSKYRQAVCIRVLKGEISIRSKSDDKEKSFFLWEDFLKNDSHYFEGTTEDSQLLIYNAWEQFFWHGQLFINSLEYGAAMIVEVKGNTRLYRCNDLTLDEDFDDIIFEITMNK